MRTTSGKIAKRYLKIGPTHHRLTHARDSGKIRVTMSEHWNPIQYDRFKAERSQPFWDLCAGVDFSKVHTALDLGCGTGELTAAMAEKFQIKMVLGIDSSSSMLEKSKKMSTSNIHFQQAKIEDFKPKELFDLVISNAALQWTDNHKLRLSQIAEVLNREGQLAIQMPANHDHPSHKLAGEVAKRFNLEARETSVQGLDTYAQWLFDLGLKDIQVTMKVYLHPMKSADEVVEWTKGTLLTHYQNLLEPTDFLRFLEFYSAEWSKQNSGGPYLYTFKRLLLWASKI